MCDGSPGGPAAEEGGGGNELEQQHPLLYPLGQLQLTSHRQNLCVPGATVLSSHHAAMGTLPAEDPPPPPCPAVFLVTEAASARSLFS